MARSRNTLLLLAAVALAAAALQPGSARSLQGKDEPGSNDTSVTIAVAALKAANVSVPATSTIFAPSDYAFKKLAAKLNTTVEGLLGPALISTSTSVLALHVVPGAALKAGDIPEKPTNVTSLLGPILGVVKRNGKVYVRVGGISASWNATSWNSTSGSKGNWTKGSYNATGSSKNRTRSGRSGSMARVVQADVPFGSSVVHVINSVLLPPGTSLPSSKPKRSLRLF